MALRARSPQALEAPCRRAEASGFEVGWIDGDMGRAGVPLRAPGRHVRRLYYETEWYQAPAELKPA